MHYFMWWIEPFKLMVICFFCRGVSCRTFLSYCIRIVVLSFGGWCCWNHELICRRRTHPMTVDIVNDIGWRASGGDWILYVCLSLRDVVLLNLLLEFLDYCWLSLTPVKDFACSGWCLFDFASLKIVVAVVL